MSANWPQRTPTALLVLADGTVIEGDGIGAEGEALGEVCFNTSLTGYQEILTDPSYARQIVTFTFPHIGNVGANDEDVEDLVPDNSIGAVGVIFRAEVSAPSNYRSAGGLDAWLKKRGVVALSGIDTRALTALIREKGMPNAVIAHRADGVFDVEALKRKAADWSGLVGLDLAKDAATASEEVWTEGPWVWDAGYGSTAQPDYTIVAIDYGAKRNILRLMSGHGARVVIVPATTSAAEILKHKPDGIFLSNGPGDPAATGEYAVPVIQELSKTGIPMFGICLGHQLLALALGGRTEKMHQGHHGANHPVKDFTTGKVEIVSMNHGFAVDPASLPETVEQTHISLFDGTNCGLRLKGQPVFSVQHHPEASPGPQDSHYLFQRFFAMIDDHRTSKAA
ncbi:glutamine-hydrolyzing carbamoyl-phosphate synthase small subunit [Aureimonas sp. AU20]|uniref:glutamine-hydrolyzing carbamoyl-phosphate synthase small subunit n=1 Tax=Aureimonas sp. AU20 TaxID=1349819 RepID=UPI0007825743|nr:glutamine-hydrolyzing carbamoyl-phosphate synthase small subunit [Aureimonas sp. AU20]